VSLTESDGRWVVRRGVSRWVPEEPVTIVDRHATNLADLILSLGLVDFDAHERRRFIDWLARRMETSRRRLEADEAA
jgi:hypothetical protein